MASWAVSRRIYTGFGITLFLLCVLAVVSLFATWNLSSVFSEYRGTARQSLFANNLIEDLYKTRMSALKYRIASSELAEEEVRDNAQNIIDKQSRIAELFESEPEWAARMEKLSEDAKQYVNAFDQMTELQTKREELVSILVKTGPKARKQLTSVMETAYRDNDSNAAFYAGIAQEQLMLGRFYAERYLLTNGSDAYNQANSHFEEASSKLTLLLSVLQNPTRRTNTKNTIKDIALYSDTFIELSTVLSNRNTIRNEQLDVLGPKMQKEYGSIVEVIADRQNIIGPRGSKQASSMMMLVIGIALIAFLLGGLLALKISRSVSDSVRRMAKDMDELANENFDIEIHGAEFNHELGLMAKSLTVFRSNGLRIKALADEKDKANAIAAQERIEEKARAQMMSDLQFELSTVVNTAIAGDFSQRVPANFSDPVLNNLAEGVNLLLKNTEKGLNETVSVLAAMSKGDLTARMESEYQGAFDRLKQDANKTNEQLSEIITNIKENSKSVKTAAGKISEGNMDLRRRTESQASSLEETSASMEEMTSSVKQNADNAQHANQLAISAQDQAQQGADIVGEAVSAMREIDSSSNKITNIIAVIDEIAFQTNLLALNASVEAARAGEHGRGFAVVATEVRNLAGRSGTAAKEIKDLISDSSLKVEEGSRLVNQSGETLQKIMNSVKKVTEIVGDIASSSQEQASGIEQVNKAINDMDSVTQQNSALVEEASASAESMNEQSTELSELVEFFNIEKTQQHVAIKDTKDQQDRRSKERPWSNDPTKNNNPTTTSTVDEIESSDWVEF